MAPTDTRARPRLPEPTADMDVAKADLAEHGYCLVADALSGDELAAVRQRLVDVAAEEVAADVATIDQGGPNQRVWQLLNRGQVFCDLAEHPLALELMTHLLGGHVPDHVSPDDLPNFLLGNLAANIAGPGGTKQYLHADQIFAPVPWPEFPLSASVMWMLDDFTEVNGATRMIPGTHRKGRNPGKGDGGGTVPAEAPAGTAMVFDGRVWHGTGANVSDSRRHGILAYYSVPWIRQQENHTVSVSNEVVRTMSATLRRLIGFDPYAFYGMIEGVRGGGDIVGLRASR